MALVRVAPLGLLLSLPGASAAGVRAPAVWEPVAAVASHAAHHVATAHVTSKDNATLLQAPGHYTTGYVTFCAVGSYLNNDQADSWLAGAADQYARIYNCASGVRSPPQQATLAAAFVRVCALAAAGRCASGAAAPMHGR